MNDEAILLCKSIKIDGIINDFSSEKFWHDHKIFKLNQINYDAVIINCSTSISPISVKKKLNEKGFNKVIDYFEICQINDSISLPYFCIEFKKDFNTNFESWQKIYNLLHDYESKKVFLDILSYRFTANPNIMVDYSVNIDKQYIEYFMNYNNEIMVDVGGFDGDTSEAISKEDGMVKKIHFIEPSKVNIKKAKSRLKDLNYIEYYNVGVSDNTETVFFDENLGSSSKVTSEGTNKINVDLIDNIVQERVSLIKMDIEGFEMKALIGCKNHIINDQPKLAIAVYHNSSDFWKIPEFIFSIRNDYEIFIRHYTEGWSETVMYFKPINK
jgi:FkbM family methyltransferase